MPRSRERPLAQLPQTAQIGTWAERDVAGLASSTPVVVFYPQWGWVTDDGAQALGYLRRFGSVTVLNGHIHQIMQKVEGNVTFHTARSIAFPQPAAGDAPSPGPMKVPVDTLRALLGIREVRATPAARTRGCPGRPPCR